MPMNMVVETGDHIAHVKAVGSECSLFLEKLSTGHSFCMYLTPALARVLAAKLLEVADAATIKVGDEVRIANGDSRGVVVGVLPCNEFMVHWIGQECSNHMHWDELVKVV